MAKAVANGMPKLRIEECAARRQARIDSKAGKSDDVSLTSKVLCQRLYFQALVWCLYTFLF